MSTVITIISIPVIAVGFLNHFRKIGIPEVLSLTPYEAPPYCC